jgi:TonB-dependent starch-binding outer membrane protein SusC
MNVLKRKWALLAASAMLCATGLFASDATAQTGEIRGTVVDAETQRPVANAQVTIPEHGIGGLTGQRGRFTLQNVPAGQVAVAVQRIGYRAGEQTVTVTAGEVATTEFTLRQSAVELDALVVTGTADGARARELGTSLGQISADDLEFAPVRNPADALMGRVSGVTVELNSGQPGAASIIRLRGPTSLSASRNWPLIYVDGVRMYNRALNASWGAHQYVSPLSSIDAADIESIEVVRGAAATTLYGSEAAGGVIQIFTKRGRAGAPVWQAEVTTGFNNPGHIGASSDPSGLYLNDCTGDLQAFNHSTGEMIRFRDATCPASGSWLRNGPIQRYSASVRGGGQDLTYYFSGNYGREAGVIDPGYADDAGFRGNFSFRPLDNLDFLVNAGYTTSTARWIPDGNNASGFMLNVARGPFGNFRDASACADDTLDACMINGHILTQENYNWTDHFISGFTARWEPSDAFSHRLTLGYDYVTTEGQTLYPFGFLRFPGGDLGMRDLTRTTVSADYAGSWNAQFGRSITSTFSVGAQVFEENSKTVYASGEDFAGPGTPTITSGARTAVTTDSRIRVVNPGFFVQEMLGFQDRLFLTVGARFDGHSAFGEDFGMQMYPKLSASWVVSDHDFWPVHLVEAFRLRGAIGEAGQAPGAFDAVRTWNPVAGDDGQPGFTPSNLGNPNLGPERTREVELGFEGSMIDGRLGLETTFYRQDTYDALVGMRPIPSLGFASRQLQNVGHVRNTGYEVTLNGDLVRSPRFEWSGRLNYSHNESEAVDLLGETAYTSWRNTIQEGYPVPSYIGPYVTNPNEFAEPIIEEGFIGPSYPVTTVGVGTSVTVFRDITLDLHGEYQGGHYGQNGVGYQNSRRGAWQPCFEVQQKLHAAAQGDPNALNDVTALERLKCASTASGDNDYYWWIQPADFFKLRTASLSYRIPERFLPMVDAATFTLAGRNLFTITDYDGLDPETNELGGNNIFRVEYYNIPPVRTFQASLRVTF